MYRRKSSTVKLLISILFWAAVGGIVGLMSTASGVRVNGAMVIKALIPVAIVYIILFALYERWRGSPQPARAGG